ncbi:MAG: hypothetical protein FJ261_04470 [Planctomycetes bacterium]|nr:hypothetical protein [Planctomycetota bacterium]
MGALGMFVVCLAAFAQAGRDGPLTIPPHPAVEIVGLVGSNHERVANPIAEADAKAFNTYRALMMAAMANHQEETTRLKADLLINHQASTFTRFVCFQEKWNGIKPALVSRLAGRQKCLSQNELDQFKAALANTISLVPEEPNSEIILLALLLDIPVPSKILAKIQSDQTDTSKAITNLLRITPTPVERILALKSHVGHATVRPFLWSMIENHLPEDERKQQDNYLCLARILMLEKQQDAALQALEDLVTREPSPEAHYLLGTLLLSRGQAERATQSLLHAAVAGNPFSASARKLLPAIARLKPSLETTRQAFDKAIPLILQGAFKGIAFRANWRTAKGGTREVLVKADPAAESFTIVTFQDGALGLAVETTTTAMRLLLNGEKEIREFPASQGMVPVFWLSQTERNFNFQFNTVQPGHGAMTKSMASIATLPVIISAESRSRMLAHFLECGWIPANARQIGDIFQADWISPNAQDEKLREITVKMDNKAGQISIIFGAHAKVDLMFNNHGAFDDAFAKAWPALPKRACEKLDADLFSRLLGSLMGLALDGIDIAEPAAK